MLLPILLVITASASEDWFYPASGPELACVGTACPAGTPPVRRTGALLVRAEDPEALAALPGVARAVPLRGDGHVVRLEVASGVDEVALARDLHGRPGVAWAHPDLALRPALHTLPDDPFVADQWHLENTGQLGWTPDVDVDAEAAWAYATGAGQVVAIIDTGVQVDHPDLAVIPGLDLIDDDDDPSPDPTYEGGPHGTAAAGLAAAIGDNGLGVAGVAWGAEVYAIRFIGGDTTLSDLYEAFVDAVDAGASVLSNSWGFGDDCPSFSTYGAIQDAMDYAETVGRGGLGAAVVVSAGNGGCDFSGDGFQRPEPVISVGALNGDDERESYSSWGDLLDVAAPSGGVLTTDLTGTTGYGTWNDDPDYSGSFSGTSASAPIVAGVVALLFDANPRLTAAQVRQVLCETAVRVDLEDGAWDEDGWSPWYGCGRVDAGAAVAAVANGAPGVPEPVAPGDVAHVDEVRLAWTPPTDPDGDALGYRVTWWRGQEDEDAVSVDVPEPLLDLTGQVDRGDLVNWTVAAVDLWGPGEGSEVRSFDVRRPAREPDGCATAPRSGRAWGIPGALVLLLIAPRRRRG